MVFTAKSPKINIQEVRSVSKLEGQALAKKHQRDKELEAIIRGEDQRILLVIGPCSSDNEEAVKEFQKVLILRVVDNKWTDHIDALDQLRNAVGLRGYAQNNPVVEYQAEGFRMFNDMIGSIEFDVTRLMMKAQIHEQERPQAERHISTTATRNIAAQQADLPADLDVSQIKRNDLCPCGSGKKFKNCHGKQR